jgi:hypothetical protein
MAEAVAVRYLKPCRFGGWPEVIDDEYRRQYGNPACCLEPGKQKIRLLGERPLLLPSLQEFLKAFVMAAQMRDDHTARSHRREREAYAPPYVAGR